MPSSLSSCNAAPCSAESGNHNSGADLAETEPAPDVFEFLAKHLADLLDDDFEDAHQEISSAAIELLDRVTREALLTTAPLLIRACDSLFELNRSTDAIALGKKIAAVATRFGDVHVQRRVYNALGWHYGDIADFTAAMQCLQQALALAKEIGDPLSETACLSNVATLMQEMGHYRQAIALCKKVLAFNGESNAARGLKIQCSAIGLFSAHRIGCDEEAAFFLVQGQEHLDFAFGELGRAFFEKERVLYLIDLGRVSEAKIFVEKTASRAIGAGSLANNQRVKTLLTISQSLCDWALGDKISARYNLSHLYSESKRSCLYHHWVLQALIKVFGDAVDPADVLKGLSFARELVEYTTSVKKAKFYRQLASRLASSDAGHDSQATGSEMDPFGVAKDWLRESDVGGGLVDLPVGDRPELAKHEELTAIHEDMARLRARSIRREIRTEAVDTAENWAIAAEFFDDETGQHCFRVGHLAAMLAREIGMSETFCVQVEHAARLHDIGKIAVNELILLKPGPLDAAEMAAMRLHTEVGAQILSGSDDLTLRMATDIARHHHEWWSGAGYPGRLVGKEIPMSARVCAYADVYDALTHARSYKKAWPHERALEEIVRLRGTQFDPDLMDPFCRVLDRYRGDLASDSIPGFVDMDSNTLIASRKRLMETISG